MRFITPVLMAVLATTSMAASVKYNGENRGKPVMPAQSNAKWATECAACHMAYPPGLLPAASWQKVMTGLGQHFGTDASLPAAEAKEITDYLVKYAAIRWTSSAAPLRITEGQWFKAKHYDKKEIAPAVWQRESVTSPGNCMACHSAADKGNFDEKSIKIPQ
ncbi:diheme cytochrome c [Rhodoferax sp.]|uniref:diheme cytochrome c n=1 Tax=Rhodoferax sp. TaxID=50421 RepID=UPI001A100534|nr:diheme cytochrome c [Rhodoferax sp.]MBE0474042.1 diheme cytochrome c [Rhodoferax sp.]